MTGNAARKLKQSFAEAQDEAQRKRAALQLLRHSLDLGHRKLSLKRLEDAIRCGAALEEADLHRCAELALRVSDTRIHARLARLSRQLAGARDPSS
ncbi:MAG: hypothetical protein KDG52_18390 [Rhodocyclaceae bacterium]|nr:hypothetical protein [Rhodocyclaceae bacterium]